MAKKKTPLTFPQIIQKIKKAGINPIVYNQNQKQWDDMDSLNERIKKIMQLQQNPIKPTDMIYFIMYDIEDNKVRNAIAKFLKNKSCIRVQKSIFIANTDRARFQEIYQTLAEINSYYDNQDSIILIPVSTDALQAMKLIGKNIDFELVCKNKNTLFF